MKLTRRKLTCCAALLLLAVAVALKLWLNSGAIRRAALNAVSEHYDGHVEFDSIALSISGGAVLNGVRLHQTGDPHSAVLCEISRVELEGSLLDMMAARFRPTAVTLHGLRLSVLEVEPGRYCLPLPVRWEASGESPRGISLHVKDARLDVVTPEYVTLARQKQLHGISLDVTDRPDPSDPESIPFAGKVADPLWGGWTFSGAVSGSDGQIRLRLQNPSLELTRHHVEWLGPLVLTLLEHFKPAGNVAVDAELAFDHASADDLQYQVLIDPQNLSLEVPTIPGKIRDVVGRIEITPEFLRVHTIVGRLDGGELRASGVVNRNEDHWFDSSLEVRHLPLAGLGDGLLGDVGASAPELTGTLKLAGSPDPQSWSGAFDGTLRYRDDHEIVPLEIHADIKSGVLIVRDLTANWGGGRLIAQLEAPLNTSGDATGTLQLSGVSLGAVWRLIGSSATDVDGSISGGLDFAVPIREWADGRQWHWTGPVELRDAQFGNVRFASLRGNLSCQERSVVIRDATAELWGQRLHGELSIAREPPFPIESRFRVAPFDLASHSDRQPAMDSAQSFSGQLEASGQLTGTLDPYNLDVRGSALVRNLVVAGAPLGDARVEYRLAGDGFDLQGVELRSFGGRIRGRGRWSWSTVGSPEQPRPATPRAGANDSADSLLRIHAEYDSVDVTAIAEAWLPGAPSISGTGAGKFELSYPLDGTRAASSARLTGQIQIPSLRIGGVTADAVKLDFDWTPSGFRSPRWSAVLPAGRLTGSASLDAGPDGQRVRVQVASTDLDLERLLDGLGSTARTVAVRGRASTDATIQIDCETGEIRGTGIVHIKSLAVAGLPPIDSIAARLELDRSRIVLRDCHAAAWGGSARGMVTIDRSDRPANLVEVVLEQVERVELAKLVEGWPALNGRARGKLSGHGGFHIPADAGGAVFGSGEFQLRDATLAGLPVSEAGGTVKAWNGPPVESTPARPDPRSSGPGDHTSRQKVLVTVNHARAARGTADGHVLVSLADPVRYDAQFQFAGLDLGTVAQSVFASDHEVAGSLTGVIELRGTERGAQDTWGTVRLRLRDANLWPYPVFAVIAKVMKLNLTKSGAFQTAEGEATIYNGTLEFKDVRLAGDAVQLFGEGTVGLDGRIKMEVVGNVETAIPKNVPILGTMQKMLSYLQQRLVKIHLTGTLDDPTGVPVPLQDLSEPAFKFFKGIVTGTRAIGEERGGQRKPRE